MAFTDLSCKHRRTAALFILLFGAFVCIPGLVGRALAQGDQPQPGADKQKGQTFENYAVSEDGLNNTMTLNEADADSSEIVGHLHSAVDEQQRGQWNDALKDYYFVINAPKDFLYKRSGLDEDRVYIGLKEFCRQQLENFPQEGRDAFNRQFENIVKDMYERARRDLDLDTLKVIHFNYGLSKYSGDALLLTADVLYEQGNVNEAFAYYNRLITKQAATSQAPGVIYGRLSTCALKIGASVLPIMRERGKEVEGDLGNAKLMSVGPHGEHIEVVLKEFVNNVIKKLEATANAGAAATAPQDIDVGMFNRLELKWKPDNNLGMARSWNAGLFGNRLFVDPMGSPFGIGLFDARSGKIINVIGSTQSPRQSFDSKILAGNELIPQTISEDADNHYVVIPYSLKEQPVPGFNLVERWGTRLLAHNNRTNKLMWYWTDPGEQDLIGVPVSGTEARQFMSEVYLTAAPVRYGAYLYTGAVRVARPASLEYYVVCFDAVSGAIKWRTFIGEDSPSAVEHPAAGGPGALMPAPGSEVCVANDSVFFTTNMGAVGAVNAVTGDVRWVAKYHKPPQFFMGNGLNTCDPLYIWHASAPVLLPNVVRKNAKGKDETVSMLVVAPRDSDHLYAYDPDTGKRIWDKSMRANDNVPVEPNAPPRLVEYINGKAMIFQSALDETSKIRAEQTALRLKRSEEPPQETPPPAEGQPGQPPAAPAQSVLTKAQMLDLATGNEVPFSAYLGQNSMVLGRPIVFGPLVFLLISTMDKGQPIYAVIGYDTSKNDKIVVYKEVGAMCEGKKIYRMFITPDRVIFVCDGSVYAYGPAGGP